MSQLLPEGVDHLADAPFTLHQAVLMALRFLHWMEDFDNDERPPKRIWLDTDRLKDWWADVERKREEKYGSKSEDEDEGDYEENAVELLTRG